MPPRKAAATTAKVSKAAPKAAATKAGASKAGVSKAAATKAAAAPKKTTTAAKPARARKQAPVEANDDTVSEEQPSKPTVAKKASAKPVATKKAPAPKKSAAKPTVNGTAKTNGVKPKAEKDQPVEAKDEESAESKNPVNKRKQPHESDAEEAQPKAAAARPVKKLKAVASIRSVGPAINTAPTEILDVFVFGEGSSGELGLGSKKKDGKKPIDVKRPRLNHNLDAAKVGVVQIATGGMHVAVLTHDNKILTWGVNDDGALGRDTAWEGGVRDVDDEDSGDEDDDDTGINPNESTPGEVDLSEEVAPGTVFVQVAATDSATFVLTADGLVYGWGTFRGAEGIIGFSESILIQRTPTLVPALKKITKLSAGANHVLALDSSGKIFTWGSSGQFQLGRKAISRHGGTNGGLKPEPCGKFTAKNHAVYIATGSYHSFYKDNHGRIWAFGLNNFAQTGHDDDTGKDDAMVLHAKVVEALADKDIKSIDGGTHHSVAATEDGQLLSWGRIDGHQVGQPSGIYNKENTIYDEHGDPRILVDPTPLKGISNITSVTAGSDNSFALTADGKVYSWGFSVNYQTGQGTVDDIETPTLIDNTAIRGRKITFAGAGGQYSVLACPHADKDLPNGH